MRQKEEKIMEKEENVLQCGENKTEHAAEAEREKEKGKGSAVLGKFRDVDALKEAYSALEAEFTRRSQRLKELEKRADNSLKTDYKQQTPEAVEGAGTFKLIGQNKYILMYDVYMKGKYQFTETTDLKNFKVIDSEVKMNFHPRHGTIIPITRAELKRITDKWPSKEMGNMTIPNNPVLQGFHADPEILYSHQTKKYYIYSTTDGQPGWD